MSEHGNFNFSSGGIGSILSRRLGVPKYQREYSWESEQVQLLLDDLDTARSESSDYFLGTIVTIRSGKGNALEIVDGQQRLTTTTILLSTIRDYVAENLDSDMLVRSIEQDFLFTIDREAEENVSRLSLNIDDDEFFRALISASEKETTAKPTRLSHERLVQSRSLCRDWIDRKMNSIPSADRLSQLKDWLNYVEKRATVILVETENGSQAFKMFETLNDRGLRTSQADLVKSYLFGQSGSKIDQAQARWSSMLDNISEIPDDDRAVNFLRHVLIATRQFVRAQDVYDVTQNKVRGVANSMTFLTDLENLSRKYVATFNSDAATWKGHSPKTKKAIATFNKFNLQPIRPLLLALAVKFTPQKLEAAIQYLVSLSVRMVISAKTRSGTNEQAFAAAALAVYGGSISDLKGLKAALASISISDREFRQNFEVATSSKADLARYYLRSLEATNAGEKEPWFVPNEDQTEINLEHILPKKPDFSVWTQFDVEAHRAYHKRLGNLCLMKSTDNSHDGNAAFSEKKKTFAIADYELTKAIATEKVWTSDEILKRQRELAKLAIKAWPI